MGTVACYLDTNILVALLTPEPFSERADTFFPKQFRAADRQRFRRRRIFFRYGPAGAHARNTVEQAGISLSGFDEWVVRTADRVEIATSNVALATTYIRRLDLTLRTPDALHIAIARRLDATLVTFDHGMASAARALGIAVATP